MKKILFLLSALALPALAFAADPTVDAAFLKFYLSMFDVATGPLGVGLATTMLLMGGAIGVAKCSPMPTLMGVAGAAMLHFGPAIVLSMMLPPGTNIDAFLKSARSSATATASAPESTAHAASASATDAAPSVKVASSAAVPSVASAATPQTHKYLSEVPASEVAAPAVQMTRTVTQSTPAHVTNSGAALPHTVPIPTATSHAVNPTLNTKTVVSSDLMVWVGAAGAAIIAGLLGLFAFASSRRKSTGQTGYTASTAPSTGASAFTDPHGFTSQKPASAFKP